MASAAAGRPRRTRNNTDEFSIIWGNNIVDITSLHVHIVQAILQVYNMGQEL